MSPLASSPSSSPRYRTQGFIDTIPLGIGVTIYGLVYGMMARQAGIPLWVVAALSLLVFAGSAQMVTVELLAAGADIITTVITVLVVNLRHLLMSADIARFTEGSRKRSRALTAFFLTDEAYAVSYTHFQHSPLGGTAYILGCGLNIYLFWGTAGVAGYLSGNFVPTMLQPALGFAMSAAFLSMLVPLVKDKPTLAAVIAAAVVALAGNLWLPGKWYILLAALAGGLVGYWLDAPPSDDGAVEQGGGAR